MKRSISSIIVVILMTTWISCNKNEIAEIKDPSLAPDISLVPDRFDQKILLEYFTSASWGVCPEINLLRDSLVSENLGRVYAVSIHINDLLTDASSETSNGMNYMDSLYNPSGIYPSGFINRKISGTSDLSPANWRSNVNSALGTVPRCGVAIDAKTLNGNMLDVEVHTGFSSNLSGEYRLHAYLVRNSFQSADTIYAQQNDFSSTGPTPDSNSVFFNQPPILVNYNYKNILVQVINDNGPAGDIIPTGSMYRSNDFVKTFTVDLTGINQDGLKILVFVDKYGSNGTSHRIENVQMVAVGEAKDWN